MVFDHRTYKHVGGSKTILPNRIRQAGVLDYYFGWGLRFWARDEFRGRIVMDYISGSLEKDRLQ